MLRDGLWPGHRYVCGNEGVYARQPSLPAVAGHHPVATRQANGGGVARGCQQAKNLSGEIFDSPGAVTTYPEQPSYLIWRDHSFAPLTLAPSSR